MNINIKLLAIIAIAYIVGAKFPQAYQMTLGKLKGGA